MENKSTFIYVVSQPQEFPGIIPNQSPYTEGRKRPKKEEDHPRVAGGRSNKQENLHTNLNVGSYKMSRSPHLLIRILKFI